MGQGENEGSGRVTSCSREEIQMKIDLFDRLLARTFAKAETMYIGAAQVQTLTKPKPLAATLERTLEGEEELELYSGTFEGWPGNVQELLDEHGLRQHLLGFSFDGFGPMSWACGLETIETDGFSYVVFWDALESYRLLARVSPVGHRDGLRRRADLGIADLVHRHGRNGGARIHR
jgi:hypothetical protein